MAILKGVSFLELVKRVPCLDETRFLLVKFFKKLISTIDGKIVLSHIFS